GAADQELLVKLHVSRTDKELPGGALVPGAQTPNVVGLPTPDLAMRKRGQLREDDRQRGEVAEVHGISSTPEDPVVVQVGVPPCAVRIDKALQQGSIERPGRGRLKGHKDVRKSDPLIEIVESERAQEEAAIGLRIHVAAFPPIPIRGSVQQK